MAVVAVDRVDGLDGALLLAGAVGSLVSSAGKPEPPMHAPERWPYGGSRAGGPGVTTSTVSRSEHCDIGRPLRDRADPALLRVEVGAEAAAAAAGAGAGGDREPGLMDEAGQPLGRASPDDESGFEPRFSVPSAAVAREPATPTPSTIRSSRAFKHPNGAALRIAPLFGPALSDHVRAGSFALQSVERRRQSGRHDALGTSQATRKPPAEAGKGRGLRCSGAKDPLPGWLGLADGSPAPTSTASGRAAALPRGATGR